MIPAPRPGRLLQPSPVLRSLWRDPAENDVLPLLAPPRKGPSKERETIGRHLACCAVVLLDRGVSVPRARSHSVEGNLESHRICWIEAKKRSVTVARRERSTDGWRSFQGVLAESRLFHTGSKGTVVLSSTPSALRSQLHPLSDLPPIEIGVLHLRHAPLVAVGERAGRGTEPALVAVDPDRSRVLECHGHATCGPLQADPMC